MIKRSLVGFAISFILVISTIFMFSVASAMEVTDPVNEGQDTEDGGSELIVLEKHSLQGANGYKTSAIASQTPQMVLFVFGVIVMMTVLIIGVQCIGTPTILPDLDGTMKMRRIQRLPLTVDRLIEEYSYPYFPLSHSNMKSLSCESTIEMEVGFDTELDFLA